MAVTWVFNLHKIVYANLISPLFTAEAQSPLGWGGAQVQHAAGPEARRTRRLCREAPPAERLESPASSGQDTVRLNSSYL